MSNSYTLKLANDKLTFGCNAQGLAEKSYTIPEFTEFVARQIQFWNGFNVNADIIIRNTRHRVPLDGLIKVYKNEWSRLEKFENLENGVELLDEILRRASNFKFILAESAMGNRLKDFHLKSPTYAGLAAIHYTSSADLVVNEVIQTEIYRMSAVLLLQEFYNPKISMLEIKDIENRLEEHRENISELNQKQQKRADSFNNFTEKKLVEYNNFTSEKADEFNKYVTSHKKQLDELIGYYKKQLTLEEPSKHWEASATYSARASHFWLVVFILFITVPLCFMLINWTEVSDQIKLLTTTNSSLNFGSVFVFTIPALAYGWILKQFSRNYIKASDAAADARHRRTLAMTYLALNKHSNVDEKERAIILNALFRSHNTSSSLEDGPPLGLIELLKK